MYVGFIGMGNTGSRMRYSSGPGHCQGLVLQEAATTATPMPAAAVSWQMYGGAMVAHAEDDFSSLVGLCED